MSDKNVEKAQNYLNAMFGGNPNWVHLDVNGITGTSMMKGLVRAFQIQNGISDVTGTIGPATIGKMRGLGVIRKMDPNDTPKVNVCLIQCALFCKGYAAGGITGIYYNSGVAAVKKMQEDAGLSVTGEIDWKVWAGLLSLNWFTKVRGGDSTVRTIQRQLNGDWADVIGVGPCDGVVSRQTALSLVGALQAAEGVTAHLITSLNSVNFGDATTAAFPGVLREGQNSDYYKKYNKLAQYGLYFNGYDPGRFDGIYDGKMKSQVAAFQEFYGLTGIGLVTPGEVNVSTMKSLLTSKGDTSRAAKACDCSTILNAQQAQSLKNAGYQYVGRYLTGTVGPDHAPKGLTLEEIAAIKAAGLSIFPIFQDGGYELEYFKNETQGCVDAESAIAAAKRVGIPKGTTIYFAVDFDCYGYQIETFILPYFEQINTIFNSIENDKHYKVGIYAPRYVCSTISEKGYAVTSFVSDMSTGFSCNLGYPIPKNWAFDQFFEIKSFDSQHPFALDKDGYSGRDPGCKTFDTVEKLTEDEIFEENLKERIRLARNQIIYNVYHSIGLYDCLVNIGISYGKEIHLQTLDVGVFQVDISTELSNTVSTDSEGTQSIVVETGNDGNLTSSFGNDIAEISTEIKGLDIVGSEKINDLFVDKITDVALSIKHGRITYEISELTENTVTVKVKVISDDILPEDPDVNEELEMALIYKFTVKPTSNREEGIELAIQFSPEAVVKHALKIFAIVIIIIFAIKHPEFIPFIVTFLKNLTQTLGEPVPAV